MKSFYFRLLAVSAGLFVLTSLLHPLIIGLAFGLGLYLAVKFVLAGLVVFSVFRMERGGPAVASGRATNAPVAARVADDPLLSLRAVACLMVLLGHTFMVVFPTADLQALVRGGSLIWLLTSSPWGGVWVFFTLSGYLMGKGFFSGRYTVDEPSVRHFLVNRALRIMPVYYGATLIVALLVSPEIFQPNHLWMLFLISIFDYQGNFSINPIGALWSVSTEMQFYLLVPVIFLLLSRLVGWLGRAAVILPLMLLGLSEAVKISIGIRLDVYQYLYTPLISNLDCFLMGMLGSPLVALFRTRGWAPWASLRKGAVLLGIFYVGIAYVSSRVSFDADKLMNFWLMAPALSALIILAVIMLFELAPRAERGAGFCGFLIRRTQSLGLLTYCIYAWHAPVLLSLRRVAPAALSFGQSLGYGSVAILLALLMAALFYYFIELPFDRMKRYRAGS